MEDERAREGPLACLTSFRAHATENAKQLQREEKLVSSGDREGRDVGRLMRCEPADRPDAGTGAPTRAPGPLGRCRAKSGRHAENLALRDREATRVRKELLALAVDGGWLARDSSLRP
jgi:hypothetical protein